MHFVGRCHDDPRPDEGTAPNVAVFGVVGEPPECLEGGYPRELTKLRLVVLCEYGGRDVI